jgi:hypothetical protein
MGNRARRAPRFRLSALRAPRTLLALAVLAGCSAMRIAPTHRELATTGAGGDLLALSDALEALIADGRDTPADREYAYEVAKNVDANTAGAAFARAAITGRLVQDRGLRAAKLVSDVEEYGLRSRELDPDFRGGAATVLLGKLYVMAPATLLEQGDSETGLALLEEVVERHPDVPQNRLRLAEAYVTLQDPEPARPHLCFCLAHRNELRRDDQQALTGLLDDVAPLSCDQAEGTP